MDFSRKEVKEVLLEAATSAGKVLMKYFGNFGRISYKDSRNRVTIADIKSEKSVRSVIRKAFPEHSIFGEELGKSNKGSECLWLIDPLDGTTNFSLSIPFFNVAIAFAYRGEVLMSVVLNPYTKELFFGEKGRYSRLDSKKITVSRTKSLEKSVIAIDHGTKASDIANAMKALNTLSPLCSTYKTHSQELNLAYTAAGRFDCCVSSGTMPYDFAAGALIVEGAGGVVTDLNGNKWNLKSKWIVAGNSMIHKKMLQLLKIVKE